MQSDFHADIKPSWTGLLVLLLMKFIIFKQLFMSRVFVLSYMHVLYCLCVFSLFCNGYLFFLYVIRILKSYVWILGNSVVNILYWLIMFCSVAFSAFMLLVGQQEGIGPVKNWVLWCWRGFPSAMRCRLAYGPADATATHCLLLQ